MNINDFFKSVLQHDLSVVHFKVLKRSKESTCDLKDEASSRAFFVYDL